MEKNIKDYLHLYLGCECAWEHHDGNCGGTCELDIFTLERFYDGEIKAKPILRPLSDMTDDEIKFIIEKHTFRDLEIKAPFTKKNFVVEICKRLSEQTWLFQFLLCKNFDLFGLIKAGLAIDKTTLTNINDK